jgi:hypothetical protein
MRLALPENNTLDPDPLAMHVCKRNERSGGMCFISRGFLGRWK